MSREVILALCAHEHSPDDQLLLRAGIGDITVGDLRALTRELEEARLGQFLFSKRKALVEHCAQIAETCELFNGDRLKNSDPRVTIAATIRERGLSRARSEEDETQP